MTDLKILQINTSDIQGGAARAAYRLHKGLRQIAEESRMLVRHKASADETVSQISAQNSEEALEQDFFLSTVIQQQYINAHRTDLSNTLFSLPYPGYDLAELPIVRNADVIHLHWVAFYQSPVTLQRLFALGKPVVWTLHDQWAFTGGCHYSAGCGKYQKDCSGCPQLADDPFDLPAAVLADKLELFRGANLTIVTPSRWMADCARESRLFKDLRIEVIPNSLETDIFRPIPKAEAKAALGINPETITLLFAAESGDEKRKGFGELVAAIRHCLKAPDFQKLVEQGNIKILCFGRPSEELESVGVPVVALGYLTDDEQISMAYSAADAFILPSLEDNLPNTMLEAMSCGTPVISFDVGGMPDVIVNDVTGKLVQAYDVQELGDAILSLVLASELRRNMGINCRKLMEEKYSLEIQAKRYTNLYKILLETQEPTTQNLYDDSTFTTLSSTITALTKIGPHCKRIYGSILTKPLKEFSSTINLQFQICEADRAARLEVINKLSKNLEESEADRAARLEVINIQDSHISEKSAQILEKDRQIAEKHAQIAEKDAQIAELYTSISWRITSPLRWISKKITGH